ncbi:Histone H2A.J, partial [Armadillidium vulgare]
GKVKAKPKSRSNRTGLHFAFRRIYRLLRKGNYAERAGACESVYLAAVMEYLAEEVFESAGNAERDQINELFHVIYSWQFAMMKN